MTHFYTAKAIDDETIVFANHTGDLEDLPFKDPEGEEVPAGRFQLPPDVPDDQVEKRLAQVIKPHALAQPDHTILVRLSDGGQVVFWDVPKTFKC